MQFTDRFIFRKETWGYLIQDIKHDRLWASSDEEYNRIIHNDLTVPIWSENPYSYKGDYILGNIPKMDSLSAPLSISWSVTSSCNSHCVFCCTDSINSASQYREADTKQVEKIVSALISCDVMRIIIGGGEPLARRDILDMLDIFKNMHFKPVIATNGILLSGKRLDKIAESCMNIQISFDTMKPALYQALRGVDQHATVVNNIREAVKTGVLTRVVTVLTSSNVDELEQIADFLGNAGVKQWFIFEMLPSGRGKKCYDELHIVNNARIINLQNYVNQNYPNMGFWYWGNKPYDGHAVYVVPDGSLNFVNYHTGMSKSFSASELNPNTVKEFWNQIPVNDRIKTMKNFLSRNRIQE